MIFEKVASVLFGNRLKVLHQYEKYPELIQEDQLKTLVDNAKNTEWGRKYDYANIKSYSSFAENVPIQDYEDIKFYVERMMHGETNLIWPEKIHWFAQSSGTTNDKSKFIPVGKTSLQQCHYRGPTDIVATYLNNVTDSKLFSGSALILGGSRKVAEYNKNVFVGDLSAVLISNMNPVANLFRTPSKKIILMDEWEEKLELICKTVKTKNVTNLSGVPSWFLVLINKLLADNQKTDLSEIWPDLEVFFHGGISFSPYREIYRQKISSSRMRYMETYNASEGFFAMQNDLSDPAMLLLLDYGVFYEFIPMEEIDSDNPRIFPLQDVEIGRNYAMIITTNNGLWRYKIGDTVEFTGKYPHKIIITGRTKHFINAFGEELMVANAEKALMIACNKTSAKVKEYTVAPVYMSDSNSGKHQWLIEFEEDPKSMTVFSTTLDDALKTVNSDYEAKRYKNMTLDFPEVIKARNGLFYDWLKMKGKLGGQNKVPRLSNSRDYMDSILPMNFTMKFFT
jgi:hypothetical protein